MRGAACIGMGGLSVSRPPLMNATRCSVTWHAEQMNVWCSTPRAATVSSGTTFVRINSPPHAAQRITRTLYWAPTPATPQGRTSRAHSSLPSDITCPATDRMSAYLPRFTCFFLNCSRSRLIPSASRKGNSASHGAFRTAFGISSAERNTPRGFPPVMRRDKRPSRT